MLIKILTFTAFGGVMSAMLLLCVFGVLWFAADYVLILFPWIAPMVRGWFGWGEYQGDKLPKKPASIRRRPVRSVRRETWADRTQSPELEVYEFPAASVLERDTERYEVIGVPARKYTDVAEKLRQPPPRIAGGVSIYYRARPCGGCEKPRRFFIAGVCLKCTGTGEPQTAA